MDEVLNVEVDVLVLVDVTGAVAVVVEVCVDDVVDKVLVVLNVELVVEVVVCSAVVRVSQSKMSVTLKGVSSPALKVKVRVVMSPLFNQLGYITVPDV